MVAHVPLYQTSQCLSKWRSSFGSTALVMMTDFFLRLDKNIDIKAVADYLRTDYCFLCEDNDCLEPEGLYCSAFLLELIARTHVLITASDFTEIPGWDLWMVTTGKDGVGVIAIAAAAV